MLKLARGNAEEASMSVHLTIETESKAEAELIASLLEPTAKAESWRGYGVIRLALPSMADAAAIIEEVEEGARRHRLSWARVRYGDEERVFRAKGHTSRQAVRGAEPQATTYGGVRGRRLVDMIAERTLGPRLEPGSGS
jgi:hypothetical protein